MPETLLPNQAAPLFTHKLITVDKEFDLGIYAVPRSGSTWLADRLTCDDKSLVLMEPVVSNDQICLFTPHLKLLQTVQPVKLGFKSVLFDDANLNLKRKKTILLVRDYADCAVSLRELQNVLGDTPVKKKTKLLDRNVKFLENAATGAVKMAKQMDGAPNFMIVRYEDLSEHRLKIIAQWCGFSTSDDLPWMTEEEEGRQYEVKRHGVKFSRKTIGRGKDIEVNEEYQRIFGYS